MDAPKFSAIIPVYNAASYLRRCVTSLTKQSEVPVEVILVDDGSTDGSSDICDELAAMDKRIVVIHKENEGVSIARNRGLDICKGKYVTFVDSDDWVTDDYWDVLERECEKADIVFFGLTMNYDDGYAKSYHPKEFQSNAIADMEAERVHLIENSTGWSLYSYPFTKVFRNDIIREHSVKFIPGQHYYEDELFTNEYMRYANSMRVIPKALYCYRWTQGAGLTFSNREKKLYTTMADALLDERQFANTEQFEAFLTKRAFNAILAYFDDRHSFKEKLRTIKTIKEYSSKTGIQIPHSHIIKAVINRLIKR